MKVIVAVLPLLALTPSRAQDSVRNLERPGEVTKHLTTDTVDQWLFDAAVDDVVRADVSSGEFDPVISLLRLDDDRKAVAVIVPDVDEPGSRSRLLARIREPGHYQLLVHGPGNRGGGNYRLGVERFRSTASAEGETFTEGELDRDGLAHVRFLARKGESVVPLGAGVVEVIDPMGRSLEAWSGCFDTRLDGEHHLRVRGGAGSRYRVGVTRGRDRRFADAQPIASDLEPQGLDQWLFDATPGAFRVLTVEGDRLDVRIAGVGVDGDMPKALDDRPEMTWLPVLSKGSTQRFAVVFGRNQAFRVQIHSVSPSPSRYTMGFADPTVAVGPGVAIERRLAVGGSEFLGFTPKPGQLLLVDVVSDAFDPVLRLTRGDGSAFAENDDGGGGLGSRFEWLARSADAVRFQVASMGDGGGGGYRFTLTELPIPALDFGAAQTGELGPGAVGYWHLAGRKDRMLILSARSRDADVAIGLFDPSGVEIARDDDSGPDRDALLGITLPRDGEYTVVITARSGGGRYAVQAIDPDQGR